MVTFHCYVSSPEGKQRHEYVGLSHHELWHTLELGSFSQIQVMFNTQMGKSLGQHNYAEDLKDTKLSELEDDVLWPSFIRKGRRFPVCLCDSGC